MIIICARPSPCPVGIGGSEIDRFNCIFKMIKIEFNMVFNRHIDKHKQINIKY